MRRATWGLLAVLGFATTASAGGWRDLVGSAAPEVSAKTWLNVPDGVTPSLETLQGRVWLLCFFGAH
jgi:hypothetical protein